MDNSIQALINDLSDFREARDWGQFHTLRNLTASLSIEAAELLELTQWKSDAELEKLLKDQKFTDKLSDEVADVLAYLLLICEKSSIDPLEALRNKIRRNEIRYPTEKSMGSAKKYDSLD